jgi:hypothetical protein
MTRVEAGLAMLAIFCAGLGSASATPNKKLVE